MAVVKNRLKVFEPDIDSGSMASIKQQNPQKPPFGQNSISPALQKFMNKQQELLESSRDSQGSEESKTSHKSPSDGAKIGLTTQSHVQQNESKSPSTIVTRPVVGSGKPFENRRNSQVNIASVFQQDSANCSDFSSNRRSNSSEASKPWSKNTSALSGKSSTDENMKPKPLAKPGHTYPRPPPGPKPLVTEILPLNQTTPPPPAVSKKPSDFKSEVKVQNSTHSDFTKVKLPAIEQIPLKIRNSLSASSTSSSSSKTSQLSSDSGEGKVDFRNKLKPTKNQFINETMDKTLPSNIKPILPSGTSSASKVSDTKPQNAQEQSDSTSQLQGKKWMLPDRQKDDTILERKSDSKKFKKLPKLPYSNSSVKPKKPALINNVDLTVIKQEYQKLLLSLDEDSGLSSKNVDESDGDIYDEGFSSVETRSSINRHKSERISMIPDMTEAEEEAGGLYDDGHTPLQSSPIQEGDDLYVDAETERKGTQEDELDQVYEDDELFAPEKLEEERKRRQKEEAEAKKKEEKERREKEKEEEKKRKKLEKERAKREKEEMALRKKFNLTGDETIVGEGVIKQDVKGGVLGGLSLKKGQTVTIVRLDNNPQNKWLVRSEAGMGYIDSSIIEIDTPSIKQSMNKQAKGTHQIKNGDNRPFYDDVPQDGHSNSPEDEEEIYEDMDNQLSPK